MCKNICFISTRINWQSTNFKFVTCGIVTNLSETHETPTFSLEVQDQSKWLPFRIIHVTLGFQSYLLEVNGVWMVCFCSCFWGPPVMTPNLTWKVFGSHPGRIIHGSMVRFNGLFHLLINRQGILGWNNPFTNHLLRSNRTSKWWFAYWSRIGFVDSLKNREKVTRQMLTGSGVFKRFAWMSQEVSKWLVNGL